MKEFVSLARSLLQLSVCHSSTFTVMTTAQLAASSSYVHSSSPCKLKQPTGIMGITKGCLGHGLVYCPCVPGRTHQGLLFFQWWLVLWTVLCHMARCTTTLLNSAIFFFKVNNQIILQLQRHTCALPVDETVTIICKAWY